MRYALKYGGFGEFVPGLLPQYRPFRIFIIKNGLELLVFKIYLNVEAVEKKRIINAFTALLLRRNVRGILPLFFSFFSSSFSFSDILTSIISSSSLLS